MKSQPGIPEILKSQEALPRPRKQSLSHKVSLPLVSKTHLQSPLHSTIRQNSPPTPNAGLVSPQNYSKL